MIHAVIPDVQAKPGDDFSFLTCIGEYLVEKKPDRWMLFFYLSRHG